MAQGRAVREMRGNLDAAGLPVRQLAAEQRRLEERINGATASLQRQKTFLDSMARAKKETPDAPHVTQPHVKSVPPGAPGTVAQTVAEGAGAFGVVQVLRGAVVAGADVDTERSQARQAGWQEAEIRRAEERANQFAASHGVSPAGALNIVREARPTFGGDLDQTLQGVAPFFDVLTSMRQKMPNVGEGEHGRQLNMLIKGAEIMGYSNTPERLRQFADFATKMVQTHGSAMRGEEVLNFAKSSKSAGQAADFDFLKATFPTMLPELGGDRMGTAMMTLRQALVGGRMQKRTAENLRDLGLIRDEDLMRTDDDDVRGVKSVKGQDLAARNPLEWVKQHLIPAMDEKGIAPGERSSKIATLFSDRNASYMVDLMTTQMARMERDRQTTERALGLSGAQQALKDDPYLLAGRVGAGAKNVGAALTTPMMEALKAAMEAAAQGLTKTAETARKDPLAAGVGVAGGAAAGGAAAVLASGSAGWFARLALMAAGTGGGAALGGVMLPYLFNNDPKLRARAEAAHTVGQDALERSARAQRERNRDPEAARGEAMMRLQRIADESAKIDRLPASHRNALLAAAAPSDVAPGSRFSLGAQLPLPDLDALKSSLQRLMPGQGGPVDLTGKVDVNVAPVKLEGQGQVNVSVKVTGPAQVTGMSSSSSGHLRVDAGTALNEFGGAGQ
jgi:hypothetical protein